MRPIPSYGSHGTMVLHLWVSGHAPDPSHTLISLGVRPCTDHSVGPASREPLAGGSSHTSSIAGVICIAAVRVRGPCRLCAQWGQDAVLTGMPPAGPGRVTAAWLRSPGLASGEPGEANFTPGAGRVIPPRPAGSAGQAPQLGRPVPEAGALGRGEERAAVGEQVRPRPLSHLAAFSRALASPRG